MPDLGAPEMLLLMIRRTRAKKTGGPRCDLPLLLLLGLLIGDFSPSKGEFGSFPLCVVLKPARSRVETSVGECVLVEDGSWNVCVCVGWGFGACHQVRAFLSQYADSVVCVGA